MKQMLINSMVSFTLGTGASLLGLALWTGTTDLQAIKDSVHNYVIESEVQTNALVGDYQIAVESANAEIGDYQKALEQANGNISKLITAYQQAETKHQTELENANKQAEQDLAELQAEHQQELSDLQVKLGEMQTRLDSQYETDMNAIIEQANAEIGKANTEVAQAKLDVEEIIDGSTIEDILIGLGDVEVNTGGDKTVTDISEIVGE